MPEFEAASLATDFSDTSPSPTSLVAEIRSGRQLTYAAGMGSGAIRRTMLSKRRRARWLSASSSQ